MDPKSKTLKYVPPAQNGQNLKKGYRVVLGSSSEGRRIILERLFRDVEIIPPNIQEESIMKKLETQKTNPIVVSMLISYLKNLQVQTLVKNLENSIILTFDTLVVHRGEIKSKPKTKEIARKWFYSYRNDFQEIITSYTAYIPNARILVTEADISVVYLKEISDEEIEEYILRNPVETWSGGIAIEKAEKSFVIVRGTIDSIIGVPTSKLLNQLRRFSLIH